jgi:hypothetical protein
MTTAGDWSACSSLQLEYIKLALNGPNQCGHCHTDTMRVARERYKQ